MEELQCARTHWLSLVGALSVAAVATSGSAVAQTQTTLYADLVPDVPHWIQECAAAGDPATTPCNGWLVAINPGNPNGTGQQQNHEWLKAQMEPFTLPARHMITNIDIDVKTRSDDNGHTCHIDLLAIGPNGYQDGPRTLVYVTMPGDTDTHWRFNGSFALAGGACRPASFVNGLELWFRRSEVEPVNRTDLRVRAFRLIVTTESDWDGDCLPDSVDPDDDNDGVLDVNDPSRLNNFVCGDSDGDGCDDCSVAGSRAPAADGPDNDGDGLCDGGDPDDDNDGVPDVADRCPRIADDQHDQDGDGQGDACDADDDNDGVPDSSDGCPLNPTLTQPRAYYRDADGDSWGTSEMLVSCSRPEGFAEQTGDCADFDPTRHPQALEVCNDLDDDCDMLVDEGVLTHTYHPDVDHDGYGDSLASLTTCAPPPGYILDGSDCDDLDAAIHPGALELCNGIDDDCDGIIDGPACTGPFCFGDGTGIPCPCGNTGALAHGCANSVFASGAVLSASGVASLGNDSLQLHAFGMPEGVTALFLQGTQQDSNGIGTPVQDGLRCIVGTIVRLRGKTTAANAASYPQPGEPTISERGGITVPATYYYQVFYRNAATAFCPPGTSNWTNGYSVTWGL